MEKGKKRMIRFLQPPKRFPQIYLKEFRLTKKQMHKVALFGEFLGIALLTAFLVYVVISNFTPFGLTTHYNSLDLEKNISDLSPKNRVRIENNNGDITYHQFSDLIYFTTKMP